MEVIGWWIGANLFCILVVLATIGRSIDKLTEAIKDKE